MPLCRLRRKLADGGRHQEDGGEERNEREGDDDGDGRVLNDVTHDRLLQVEDVKKMYAALTALTQRNLQSGYLDRIVDEWAAFCSKIEQVKCDAMSVF